MAPVSPMPDDADSGPSTTLADGVLALLTRTVAGRRRWRGPETSRRRGAAMSDPPSCLSRLPLRAARWSATHPWRAIGAWFAFVAIAVALAALVPTQADHRRGLPARRVRPGGRDGRGRPLPRRPGRERAGHGPRRRAPSTPHDGTPRSPASCGARHRGLPGVTGASGAAVERRARRRPAGRRPPRGLRRRPGHRPGRAPPPSPATHPDLRVREAGDVSVERRHQRPRRRGPALRRGDQPARSPSC